MRKPDILLTNDDGILSPGLWAAASALNQVGFVHVVAPREQSSGMGRSLPMYSDGVIEERSVRVNGEDWTVYAVGGSPAQTVIHGVLEVLGHTPDLVVSGINFGENFGTGVTISGTVGAAMEGAALGIPSIAVSLETHKSFHVTYSKDIDFTAAADVTRRFAVRLLQDDLPPDVDLLKLEIPADATVDTPWEMSRLSMIRYYESLPPKRTDWTEPGRLDYQVSRPVEEFPPDSDVYITRVSKKIAVTALSLDFTSRISLEAMDGHLRRNMDGE